MKEWWPSKNGNIKVKLEHNAGVDDQDIVKSNIQMSFHLGSNKLAHSKRLLKNVFHKIDGSYSNIIYYGDTDSAYNHEKTLVIVTRQRFPWEITRTR